MAVTAYRALLYSSGILVSAADSFDGSELASGSCDKLVVLSGGTATETYVSAGGELIVSTGGVISGINVNTNGVYSGTAICSGASKWYGAGICVTGGGVTVNDGVFVANSAVTLNGWQGQGGAIEAYNATLNVSGGTYAFNSATGGGGAILAINGSADLAGAAFNANSALYAGAVQNNGGKMDVESCVFSGNSSPYGGAVENHNGGELTVTDTNFTGNIASHGGAIYNDYYSGKTAELEVSGGVFFANSASFGGAILNSGGEVEISGAVFSANVALYDSAIHTGGYGGAIENFANGELDIKGGHFGGNTAYCGGAIANAIAYGSTDSAHLKVSKTTFTANSASYGGAIYHQAGGTDTVTLISGVLASNTAANGGGAVCNCYGVLAVSGGVFTGNTVDGTNGDGGAIANWHSAAITDAEFYGNTADQGGAISNSYAQSLTVSGGVLSGNQAVCGGALANINYSVAAVVAKADFSKNIATSQGGAIYNTAGKLDVSGCNFIGNIASQGGAIYNTGTIRIDGAVFSGNTADDGGAVGNASGGVMAISATSFLTSGDTISNNGIITFSEANTFAGSVVNFGTIAIIADNTATRPVIDDFSQFNGGNYNIVISDTLLSGSALLAGGFVNGPTTEFTLATAAGTELGSIPVDSPLIYNGLNYSLSVDTAADTLSLDVAVNKTCGDLDFNGFADVLMTISDTTHTHYGATGAWLISSGTPVWDDLSTLIGSWELFGTGSTDGGDANSDVYLYNSNLDMVGAWTIGTDGKVTGWETIGCFDSNTDVVGLGDFDGDGQTDLLLKNTNGMVGCYLTSGTGWREFAGLGPEWSIDAIGDFNGDGVDDVALRNAAGYAGTWLVGPDEALTWANLDTLNSDTDIIGSGDFNGDGVDDILLQIGNHVGAWLVKDGSVSSYMGLGTMTFGNTVEAIADYNGDGIDDLRIRTAAGDLGALCVKGEDQLEWVYFGSVGSEWSTALAAV